MAWSFGDGFDCYATSTDMLNGYWDATGNPTNVVIGTGRFSGSRSLSWGAAGATSLKTSGVNDAVHHFVCAVQPQAAVTGTNLGLYITLYDGTTAQCSVVFRSDGAILLQSGVPGGSTLATYAGALPAINTWYGFEIEVVINNTTGSFTVRKNGNSSNDHSTTGINTRGGTANNYANKIQISSSGVNFGQYMDDFFWRSDASAVAWMGDIRCYTRLPVSDASVQFSRVPTTAVQTLAPVSSSASITAGRGYYNPFTAAYDGTISSATVTLGTGYTGNLKCSLFASSGGVPTTVLGSATVVTNPASGSNVITFGTPVTVVKGTSYWLGFDSDTSSGTWNVGGVTALFSTTAYASFPVASPSSLSTASNITSTVSIAVSTNSSVVSEAQQDAATSYVYDSTVGHADFYNIGTIGSTPAATIAVTTRAYMQKSDAGTRTAAAQIKSGATTVASPTLTLTASGWQWTYRTDLTDPATGAAWSAAAVAAATVGPVVVS